MAKSGTGGKRALGFSGSTSLKVVHSPQVRGVRLDLTEILNKGVCLRITNAVCFLFQGLQHIADSMERESIRPAANEIVSLDKSKPLSRFDYLLSFRNVSSF